MANPIVHAQAYLKLGRSKEQGISGTNRHNHTSNGVAALNHCRTQFWQYRCILLFHCYCRVQLRPYHHMHNIPQYRCIQSYCSFQLLLYRHIRQYRPIQSYCRFQLLRYHHIRQYRLMLICSSCLDLLATSPRSNISPHITPYPGAYISFTGFSVGVYLRSAYIQGRFLFSLHLQQLILWLLLLQLLTWEAGNIAFTSLCLVS